MVATLTIKLQSPAWDNSLLGEEIALPVGADTHAGTSLADTITLFNGVNKIFDFGQLREVIQLAGFITTQAAHDAGFINPVDQRDTIRRVRTVWPTENGLSAGANWGTATLPAAEQDSTTARLSGRTRLVFEKQMAGRGIPNAAITSGLVTVTAASGPFLAGDVGKDIVIPGAGAGGAALVTTVATYIGATQVTVATAAGTTVSGKRARIGQLANYYFYGTVGDFRFGPRNSASGRDRIPFAITFIVGTAATGA